jgi:hypothetical protein
LPEGGVVEVGTFHGGVVFVGTVALILIARFVTAVVVPALLGGVLLAVLANVAVQTLASFVGERDGGIRRPPRGPGRR